PDPVGRWRTGLRGRTGPGRLPGPGLLTRPRRPAAIWHNGRLVSGARTMPSNLGRAASPRTPCQRQPHDRGRALKHHYRSESTVAVKIRLMRMGKIRNPQYRIVVADSRTKRDGRAIEYIGVYHPKEEPSLIEVDSDRAQYWLSVGAQPSEPVLRILEKT